MTIDEQKWTTSSLPAASASIPIARGCIGSWEIALRRRTRTAGDLAGLYDDASKSWARMSRRFRLETAYREPLFASGVAEALVGQEALVLDCGVASGSLSLALASITTDSPEYHCIDTSGAMLAAADAELRRAGIAARLQQSDIRTIPYPDRTFDVAMAAHVLEHLAEPDVALREMVRVLKPGGILFACMTRRFVFGTFVQLRWRTWMVSERQGIARLREIGLDDIGFQPIGLGFGAGQASTAFWARKPVGTVRLSRTEGITPRGEPAR
ncbi:class I SAM-dependent methyltransferase [uncultured Tateyamaria sp.]|uniref:class I SAM-dependent methyltransferase n=1 Tax=uncultured Tateyamaria sp. TaxID=455651 RepID=UPI0026115DDC|nr:class I SAM-dependent methyltransferase [uncultured Tateyamaria sp.]